MQLMAIFHKSKARLFLRFIFQKRLHCAFAARCKCACNAPACYQFFSGTPVQICLLKMPKHFYWLRHVAMDCATKIPFGLSERDFKLLCHRPSPQKSTLILPARPQAPARQCSHRYHLFATLSYILSGRLRGIAVTSCARSDFYEKFVVRSTVSPYSAKKLGCALVRELSLFPYHFAHLAVRQAFVD